MNLIIPGAGTHLQQPTVYSLEDGDLPQHQPNIPAAVIGNSVRQAAAHFSSSSRVAVQHSAGSIGATRSEQAVSYNGRKVIDLTQDSPPRVKSIPAATEALKGLSSAFKRPRSIQNNLPTDVNSGLPPAKRKASEQPSNLRESPRMLLDDPVEDDDADDEEPYTGSPWRLERYAAPEGIDDPVEEVDEERPYTGSPWRLERYAAPEGIDDPIENSDDESDAESEALDRTVVVPQAAGESDVESEALDRTVVVPQAAGESDAESEALDRTVVVPHAAGESYENSFDDSISISSALGAEMIDYKEGEPERLEHYSVGSE